MTRQGLSTQQEYLWQMADVLWPNNAAAVYLLCSFYAYKGGVVCTRKY